MRISILRRLAAAATTLGLASVGLLGAGATPAQAAIGDCPSGYFCAWKSDNGTGTMYKTNVNQATLGSWDNAFRSIVNRTSKWLCLYDDANYSGSAGATVIPSDPAGTEWGGPGSNSISSLKFVPTERECRGLAYPSWNAATSPAKAGFGDLNADKKADVLVRDEAGRLWFLPGDSTGRLVGTGGWGVMNALTRHGDFSGDGREDVIARETATGRLWLYPGTSTGTLGPRKLLGSGGWNAMNALVAPGDMNGNGKADLITREASTGKLWLYPATASGTFGPRVLIGSGGWNVMASFLALGDFTGDGLNDLATVTTGSYIGEGCRGVGCLVLYSGKGTGGLNPGSPESQYVDWSDLRGTF